MTALLLVQVALVVLVAGLRFPDALDLVAPFPLDRTRWAAFAGVLLGLGVVGLRREIASGRPPWSDPRRATAWLTLALAPAALWTTGDLSIEHGADAVLLIACVAVAAVAWRREAIGGLRRGRLIGDMGVGLRWVLPTTLIGAGLIGLVLLVGGAADPMPTRREWAFALVSYPFYALFQLVFLLALPWTLWKRDRHGDAAAIAGCALLFSLVHWPNPFLLVGTLAGMSAWAAAWARGAGLLPLAVSMGLLGAVVAQALPPELIGHARVGPGYVLRFDHERRLAGYDARCEELASDRVWSQAGGTLEGWLRHLHEVTVGGRMRASALRSWTLHIDAAYRARVILTVLESPEYRRDRGIGRNFRESDRLLLHSTFRPWHPAHAAFDSLRGVAAYRQAGGTFPGFVEMLYRKLLDRRPSREELRSWRDHPSAPLRVEIVRSFLARAGEEDPLEMRRRTQPAIWPAGETARR